MTQLFDRQTITKKIEWGNEDVLESNSVLILFGKYKLVIKWIICKNILILKSTETFKI